MKKIKKNLDHIKQKRQEIKDLSVELDDTVSKIQEEIASEIDSLPEINVKWIDNNFHPLKQTISGVIAFLLGSWNVLNKKEGEFSNVCLIALDKKTMNGKPRKEICEELNLIIEKIGLVATENVDMEFMINISLVI